VTCFNGERWSLKTRTATASIGQTTTNTVTVLNPTAGIGSQLLPGEDRATKVVGWASALVLKDKELQWILANGTTNKLQIAEIRITWPAANGFLDEVRLDGGKINGGNFNPPSADITSFEGSTGARSIDHNRSRTLHFKFQNNASPGAYTIEVRFTNGCSVTFP
jgi:hypothetical protein